MRRIFASATTSVPARTPAARCAHEAGNASTAAASRACASSAAQSSTMRSENRPSTVSPRACAVASNSRMAAPDAAATCRKYQDARAPAGCPPGTGNRGSRKRPPSPPPRAGGTATPGAASGPRAGHAGRRRARLPTPPSDEPSTRGDARTGDGLAKSRRRHVIRPWRSGGGGARPRSAGAPPTGGGGRRARWARRAGAAAAGWRLGWC